MGYVLLLVIALLACVPMFLGPNKFRSCYKGCHGCGKCMTGFKIRSSAEEKEPLASPDEGKS